MITLERRTELAKEGYFYAWGYASGAQHTKMTPEDFRDFGQHYATKYAQFIHGAAYPEYEATMSEWLATK